MENENTGPARRRLTAVSLLCLAWLNGSSAHPIVVDGQDGDWVLGPPIFTNVGHVTRDEMQRGEFVWRDSTADARTDFSDPETDAEITEFRVTADPDHVFFLIRLSALTQASGAGALQIQIAVDLDQGVGSGAATFAGGADTSVAAAAEWEFLLATRFGSGGADVNVIATDFSATAAGAAAINTGNDLIELSVPWTALGLAGPPATPLRVSVASFRSTAGDLTLDIGGPSVSDALDVITNNDSPGFTVPTLAEVGDQVLDYHLDLWFGADGEVVSPLLVSAFEARPTSFIDAEWIEIHNRSTTLIDLQGYRVGDEETPGASENMSVFPSAAVPPGGFLIVARSAAAYTNGTGLTPDFEIDGTAPGVPDLVADPAWGAGGFVLDNSTDQILLLDDQRNIVDAVAYGGSGVAGVEPLVTPANGEVDYRAPAAQDRNLAADFSSAAGDLTVTITNDGDSVPEGGNGEYEIEVTNNGPDDAFASAMDIIRLEGMTLTGSDCRVIDLGAACTPIDIVGGSGAMDLPVNTRVEFSLTAVAAGFAAGPAILGVTAAMPLGVGERFPADNSAEDLNTIQASLLFGDSFED